MLKSIKCLLDIATYYDYETWQIDVKTKILNENLQEDLYVTQVESFEYKELVNKVYKLLKFICELKQASMSRDIHFDEIIKQFNFIKNMNETCVCRKKVSENRVIFLILYVEDILLIGNDISLL